MMGDHMVPRLRESRLLSLYLGQEWDFTQLRVHLAVLLFALHFNNCKGGVNP